MGILQNKIILPLMVDCSNYIPLSINMHPNKIVKIPAATQNHSPKNLQGLILGQKIQLNCHPCRTAAWGSRGTPGISGRPPPTARPRRAGGRSGRRGRRRSAGRAAQTLQSLVKALNPHINFWSGTFGQCVVFIDFPGLCFVNMSTFNNVLKPM